MQFQKAEKSKSLLRCAVFGPPGAGKTFTALRMGKGMGGRMAFIDTERGSASKYADRFEFDVLELPDTDINTYVEAMELAAKSRYEILIIDSLSHAWQELLQEVDKLANAKYRGNTWSAWSEGTPKQKKLVNAILTYPGHIIATMRSKIEYSLETTSGGKNRPVKVGMAPEQGKGIEYEFDFLLELTQEHYCTITKDRTGKFQDKIYEKPGEDFGQELIAWLKDGKDRLPNQKFVDTIAAMNVDAKVLSAVLKKYGHKKLDTVYDRDTQSAVYHELTAPKEEPKPQLTQQNKPVEAQSPEGPSVAPTTVPNAPQAQPDSKPAVNPNPIMDETTQRFLSAMKNIKQEIAAIAQSEIPYYDVLGANGFTHANEIHDSKAMKMVYKDLQQTLKDIREVAEPPVPTDEDMFGGKYE